MSLIKPMLLFFFLLSGVSAFAQTPQPVTDTPFMQKDTTYWVYNFRQFRDAVYQGDKKKARAFVDVRFKEDFNDLFRKDFINCLLKIKTEELYKDGEYNTVILTDGPAKSYSMIATWDKANNEVTLNMLSKTAYKEDGEEGISEFAIIYVFEITKKGHIKLTSIGFAG